MKIETWLNKEDTFLNIRHKGGAIMAKNLPIRMATLDNGSIIADRRYGPEERRSFSYTCYIPERRDCGDDRRKVDRSFIATHVAA